MSKCKSLNLIDINIAKKLPSPKYDFIITINTNPELAGINLTQETKIAKTSQSDPDQFTLPFMEDGNYDCRVYWDINNLDVFTDFNGYPTDTSLLTHTYDDEGIYTIKISGLCEGWRFYYEGDFAKLIDIKEWGSKFKLAGNNLTDIGGYFGSCYNLNISATNRPNLKGIRNLSDCFVDCTNLNSPNLSIWDVSNVENMSFMLNACEIFDQPLNTWKTSNVTNMAGMFSVCSVFNQPLNDWDVSNVKNMSFMFSFTNIFNQPLDKWNVSKVENMSSMFSTVLAFNQSLNTWNTINVENMFDMFYGSTSFNGSVNEWNVSKVTNMARMFYGAIAFKQNISSWTPTLCTNMSQMFGPSNPTTIESVDMNTTGTTTNYDALLNSWAGKTLQTGVTFSGGASKYSQTGLNGRNTLISKSWNITDGGPL
jgi:surface protein